MDKEDDDASERGRDVREQERKYFIWKRLKCAREQDEM
jgi:hypothetical protein